MPELGSFLLIGAVAAVVTFATTPLVGLVARRHGWVYLPNDRTVHQTPLPDVGGLAMYFGFLAAMAAAWMLDAFAELFESNSEPIGVVVAATIIYVVGFVDDVRGLSPPAKVTGTVVAGLALVQFGVVMYAFRLPFFDGPILLAAEWRPLVTVLWLIGMTQAINLIDGLDGLAAGIVAIGAGAFFLYSQELIDRDVLDVRNIGPLLAIIAVGVCVGFLPFNFNPARIFMGDGGALLLGLLLAVATSVIGGRADSFSQEFVGQTYFFLAPLAIPLLILGVPIFDLAFRDLPSSDQPAVVVDRRQGPPAPPPDGSRPRPPPQRGDPVDLDAAAVGVRAVPDAHRSQPDVSTVRHRRAVHRVVHRAAPECSRPQAGDRRTGRSVVRRLDDR